MKLSKIKANIDIARDGSFEAFGLLDSPTTLSILAFIGDAKFAKQIGENVTCIICPPSAADKIPGHIGIITSDNPKVLFFKLHNQLSQTPPLGKKQQKTIIGKKCSIHKTACIADSNVRIGNNVLIEEFVSIKENTTIGDNAIVRAGSIVGGMGFYYTKQSNGKLIPVEHFGGVVLEDDVELQQSCHIDRAYFTWDNTVIGQGSKLDNMVHVAHAAKIGKNVLLTSCISIAGNVIVEDNTYIGPGSTVTNNVIIGENAKVSIGAVVARNVPGNTTVTGNFAVDHKLFLNDMKATYKRR